MFLNRKDAAEKLAHALEKYRNKGAIVLGIPRGGAETAYYVAQYLNADLSLAIARKLGYPSNPEAAFGAVAEDGSVYIFDEAKQSLTQDEINSILYEQEQEIQRRIHILRHGKPLPDMEGKTVIIVDDGIATGATLFTIIELCKKKNPGKIVVAAPISGRRIVGILRKMTDDVVILETPQWYSSVSQGYEDFCNLTDEEALLFIDKWNREHSHSRRTH
jgi:predicted phosphoribosyltransferase